MALSTLQDLPSISVIIPVYNGGKDFNKCLQSISQTVYPDYEVIVVADGDTDGSWLLAKNFGVTVIRNPISVGPAKARNLGAKMARGELLFFVDADVEIYPDTLEKVAMTFQQEADISALIGCYDDAPGAKNFLSQYKNLFHHYTHQTASEDASTFWGACGSIRRDIFWEIGGFDEKYRHPSVEDIELGYRLKRNNHRIKLCKNIQVKHLKRWEVISLLKAEFFYRALPWTALILRDRQMINDLNLKLKSRISIVLIYTILVSLGASFWWTSSLILTSVLSFILLILNAPVYQFFHTKRGLLFALQTVIWHWLYYFYSGLAFAVGVIHHQIFHNRWPSLGLLEKLSFVSR
ncbi:glycosyltransferase [Nostoc linckia FACHB-104]|nr:glycosyltransferase [Nostoc linckia FACHB-104]